VTTDGYPQRRQEGLLGGAYRLIESVLKVIIRPAQTSDHFARELDVFDLAPH
jgi:hypothetical protein